MAVLFPDTLSYDPPPPQSESSRPRKLFRPRRTTSAPVHLHHLPHPDFEPSRPPTPSPHLTPPKSFTLAVARENAKKFLRSVTANQHTASDSTDGSAGSNRRLSKIRSRSPVKRTTPGQSGVGSSDDTASNMRGNTRPTISGPVDAHPARNRLLSDAASLTNTLTHTSTNGGRASPLSRSRKGSVDSAFLPFGSEDEKPVASGNGITVGLLLAEPCLFLQGYSESTSPSHTAMLRGSLHLRVQKSAKIKTINLKFRGKSITRWPEGIPPRKVDFDETDTIMSHTWPFFNAQFESAENGTSADRVQLFRNAEATTASRLESLKAGSPNRSQENLNLNSKEARKLALSVNQNRSFGKGDAVPGGPTVAAKGYRTFLPGDYIYNFELPLDSRLPETIDVDLGSVKYELEATVERSGAFRGNLVGVKEVTLIRAPGEGSLEQVEPIAISRNWEDQLHYDIVISGKSFPLGSQVPIAFKLTPLAKVQCHRIRVLVTENIEYFCSNKRVHRMEPTRKVQLFEKRADGAPTSTFDGSTMRVTAGGGIPYDLRASAAAGEDVRSVDTNNLLGDLEGDTNVGPTEMEFSVQLPSCQAMKERDRSQRLHFDTTFQNIQVHHWIKIVMRLSKPDPNEPGKRRHFEISIDSPFHILSCRATQANICLPAYSSPLDTTNATSTFECGCPGAPRRRNSPTSFVPTLSSAGTAGTADLLDRSNTNTPNLPGLQRPPTAHLGGPQSQQRPIHLLRAPSFNPPAFEDSEPPPPLITPPPMYESIASPTHGLSDYFARLSDAYEDDDEDGDESHRLGRVNIPLTPGARVNRSMDIPRESFRLQVGQ